MKRLTVGKLLELMDDIDIDTEVLVAQSTFLSPHPAHGVLISRGERNLLVITSEDIDAIVGTGVPVAATKGGE